MKNTNKAGTDPAKTDTVKSILEQYLNAGKIIIALSPNAKVPTKEMGGWSKFTESPSSVTTYTHKGNHGWALDKLDMVLDIDVKAGGVGLVSFVALLKQLGFDGNRVKALGDALTNKHNDEFENALYDVLNDMFDGELLRTVLTPSGGFHIYLRIPESHKDVKFSKHVKDYPNIDVLTKGSYVVIPPSVFVTDKTNGSGSYTWHDDISLFGEFNQHEAPVALMNHLQELSGSGNKGDGEAENAGDGVIDASDINEYAHLKADEVVNMVSCIDPATGRVDWLNIGMAVHRWSDGKDEGLMLFECWSKGEYLDQHRKDKSEWDERTGYPLNYTPGGCNTAWNSFTTEDKDKLVTLSTVKRMARQVKGNARTAVEKTALEKVSVYVDLIKQSTDGDDLQINVTSKIRMESFVGVDLDRLSSAYKSQYKKLTGELLTLPSIRRLMLPVPDVYKEGEKPFWCNDQAFLLTHNAYVNISTLALRSVGAFNNKFSAHIPGDELGRKPLASKYAADGGFIDEIDRMEYAPASPQGVSEIGGKQVLNSYDTATVPNVPDEHSANDLKNIDLVQSHIKLICGEHGIANMKDTVKAKVLLGWLAWQIQHPGVKIPWGVIIQGRQGIGKSFFAELLKASLGNNNVGVVKPNVINGDYNGWATGVVTNVFEEMRVVGKGRLSVANELKTLITDSKIQVNEKYIAQHTVTNTTNYIGFTNYIDAIPLDDDDRRWFVVFAPYDTLDDLSTAVGKDHNDYFTALFGVFQSDDGGLRKWLLEEDLTAIKKLNRAPMTSDKAQMIATGKTSIDGQAELEALIASGDEYYDKKLISSSHLFASFDVTETFNLAGKTLPNSRKNKILRALNYRRHPKQVKIKGRSLTMWYRLPMSNREIREYLNNKPGVETSF